jgi:glutathione S-transferase
VNHPPITLRYFAARGRAQFLRYYFHLRKIAFTDERVSLGGGGAEWQTVRDDRRRSGPFQKLPVLGWGDRVVAETLMIAAFVHEALGDAGALSDDDNLRHGMLTSSLYCDVMMPIGTLLWAEVVYPGTDMRALAKATLERLARHCKALDQSLSDWRWLDRARRRRVMLADCLLFEELAVAELVFGASWSLAATPTLAKFYEEFPGRPNCETVLREQPAPVTARPEEPAAIAKLQTLLAD